MNCDNLGVHFQTFHLSQENSCTETTLDIVTSPCIIDSVVTDLEIEMNWNLEGLTVTGLYMGTFPVTGRVETSRVKYGGGISHHIVLESPITVYGAVRDRVILEHGFVSSVRS